LNTSHISNYCHQKAITPGSSLYYSLRFSKPSFHPGLLALFALETELLDTGNNISDPDVARKKLSWWAEEIERMFNIRQPNPRHPVTQALRQFAPILFHPETRENQYRRIQLMMQAALWDINYQGYQTYDDIKTYTECQKGTVIQLAMIILLEAELENINTAALQLGMALQFNHIIQFLGKHLRANKVYFPEEELAAYEIKTEDLLALTTTGTAISDSAEFNKQLKKYLTFFSNRAQTEYQAALTLLNKTTHNKNNILKKIKPILLLNYLENILLCRIEKSGFNIIHQRIELTPIEKIGRAFIFNVKY
jgi:phytoene synthase